MSITAKLTITLLADTIKVAESENPKPWQIVLEAIQKELSTTAALTETDSIADLLQDHGREIHADDLKNPVQTFAQKIKCQENFSKGHVHTHQNHPIFTWINIIGKH